jgi:hypothetical protein
MRIREEYQSLIRELSSKPIGPAVVVALRKQVGPSVASELLELASLQAKANKKFGDGVWMATARSIEQASDRVVADYKASLVGDRVVIDACGGIGGDAMGFARGGFARGGFARRGSVVTIDSDPRMTGMASDNLRSTHAENAVAVCADAMRYWSMLPVKNESICLHIDPDRRPNERKTSDPSAYLPSLEQVMEMVASSTAAMIKLAPAANLPESIAVSGHRRWISYAGTVREQSLLFGEYPDSALVSCGTRSAVRLMRDGTHHAFRSSHEAMIETDVASAAEPRQSIIDIDPAIRAAGLSAEFACAHSLQCLGDASGFFTTDEFIAPSPLHQAFECAWSGPADLKQIRKQVERFDIAIKTVKVRGTDHDPQVVLKALKPSRTKAEKPATLFIGRQAEHVYAVLALPLGRGEDGSLSMS